MITKKDVVKAIDFAAAIFMILFIGMSLEVSFYLTTVGESIIDAFGMFVLTTVVVVALFISLQYILKALFGQDILKMDCPCADVSVDNPTAMGALFLWAKNEYEISPDNQLVGRKETYENVMKEIRKYLPGGK